MEARRSGPRGAAADGGRIVALIAVAVLWAWTWGGGHVRAARDRLAVFVIGRAERTRRTQQRCFVALAHRDGRARGCAREHWALRSRMPASHRLIGIVCETTWNSEYIAR